MPILLKAPSYNPRGRDGKGWNRLSLNAHIGTPADQCALQPRTYASLHETRRDTRLAQWGNYGRCTSDGDCGTCPIFMAKPLTMGAFGDRVLVRIMEWHAADGAVVRTQLWAMDRVEDGWSSFGYLWTWVELVRLTGWLIGRQYRDEHSDGFWLVKVDQNTHDGRPSPCPHGYINPRFCDDRKCKLS